MTLKLIPDQIPYQQFGFSSGDPLLVKFCENLKAVSAENWHRVIRKGQTQVGDGGGETTIPFIHNSEEILYTTQLEDILVQLSKMRYQSKTNSWTFGSILARSGSKNISSHDSVLYRLSAFKKGELIIEDQYEKETASHATISKGVPLENSGGEEFVLQLYHEVEQKYDQATAAKNAEDERIKREKAFSGLESALK